MVFNAIYPLRGIFSTRELNWEIRRFFRNHEKEFCLEENDQGLLWNGRLLTPEIRHIYVPDPQAKIPESANAQSSEQMTGEKKEMKEVWVQYPRLFRSERTRWCWVAAPMDSCYAKTGALGSYIETLFLQEDFAVLEIYVVTDDPTAEDSPMEFEFYEAPDGSVMISDINRYTERLTIPSEINHKPVAWAAIPYSWKVRHLRELVVQEGVKRIDFTWSIPELEKIVLPASTALIRQPDLIHFSKWYKNQPVGPVYLANWYLGYKGSLPWDRTLSIRPGTLGIISDCDRGAGWKRIILPDSMTYIGDGAFSVPYRTVDVVSRSKVLAAVSDPFLYGSPDDMEEQKVASFCCEDGKSLYDLCMKCPELCTYMKAGQFPLPPRLRRMHNKWGAEYLLTCSTRAVYQPVTHCAAFELEGGKLLNPPARDKYYLRQLGCWTKDYLPPSYLRSVEYLDYCAHLIQTKSAPEEQDLQLLDKWWYHITKGTLCHEIEMDMSEDEEV